MKTLSVMTIVVVGCSVCRGMDLPRSSPEAQGIESSAILSFVESADKNIDAMNSFMLVASRARRGGRLVGAVQCRVAALFVLAEQEFHLLGRRPGHLRRENSAWTTRC